MREQDRVESAARVLKDFAQIKREPKLLKAARAQLRQEIKDSQKELRETWKGHYKIVSSLDQILQDMKDTLKKFGV